MIAIEMQMPRACADCNFAHALGVSSYFWCDATSKGALLTERKYDLLIQAWEQTAPKESNLYQMKIELLQELYEEQKTILEREVRFEEIQAEGR